MTSKGSKRIDATVFRVNVSYLSEKKFGKFPILGKDVKRQENVSTKLDALKRNILELLLLKQKHKGLIKWNIAWQTHQSNGLAHLDILLIYQKNIKKSLTSLDWLLEICPQDTGHFSQKQGHKPKVNITGYSLKRLNQAIIQYGEKEDPKPLSNLAPEDSARFLTMAEIKRDPFRYFELIMDKDPYNFDIAYYAKKYDLAYQIPGWSSVKSKLNDIQAAARALTEQKKPGIKYIDRPLIEQNLLPQQLQIYDQYPCFPKIIEFINQIPTYGYNRPHKTLNLYIHGPQGIGKSSLINQGNNNLSQLVPHYDINLQNKYLNRYTNNVYGFISWNQMKYTDFSPNWVLKLLEGADLQIPIRYSSNIKRDNPLIIATSNLSLSQQIQRRFHGQPSLQRMAKSNLLDERIVEVYVPVKMFFLQKLIISACEDSQIKTEKVADQSQDDSSKTTQNEANNPYESEKDTSSWLNSLW